MSGPSPNHRALATLGQAPCTRLQCAVVRTLGGQYLDLVFIQCKIRQCHMFPFHLNDLFSRCQNNLIRVQPSPVVSALLVTIQLALFLDTAEGMGICFGGGYPACCRSHFRAKDATILICASTEMGRTSAVHSARLANGCPSSCV